jgi:hypothetical protein
MRWQQQTVIVICTTGVSDFLPLEAEARKADPENGAGLHIRGSVSVSDTLPST